MTELGLIDIADALGHLESEKLRVYPLQCVRLRHRKSQCTLCADHCPTGAIIWGNSVQINVDKCIECGLCAAVCPTGVFEASNPSNQELLAQINELAKITSTIAFVCPSVTGNDASGVIRVPCLGRLDASILVGAAAAGILQVDLVDSACTRCPDRIGHVVAEQAIAKSNALLQACGTAPLVAFKSWSDLLDQPAPKTKQINHTFEDSHDEIHHAANQLPKGTLPVRVPVKKHARVQPPEAGSPRCKNGTDHQFMGNDSALTKVAQAARCVHSFVQPAHSSKPRKMASQDWSSSMPIAQIANCAAMFAIWPRSTLPHRSILIN